MTKNEPDKGRDWREALLDDISLESESAYGGFVGSDLTGRSFNDICIWAESIVKKELAEKVNRLPISGYYGQYVKIDDVLSLLTDKGKEQ